MHQRTWVLIIICSFVVSGAARAAGTDDARSVAREHYEKGRKAFELGIYQKAIDEYMAAYEAKDDPAILYNLGQAHRLAGNSNDALHFYKMFLIKAPDASNRVEVENKIAELQKLIQQQAKTKNMPPDGTLKSVRNSEDTPPKPVESTPATPATIATQPQTARPVSLAPSRGARAERIAGLSLAAVGVAALATGIGFAVATKNAADSLSALDQSKGNFNFSKQQSGLLDQSLSRALIPIGAVALVAGGVLTGLGYRHARSERRVALVPVVGAGTVALQVGLEL
jgi:tetratricopeptide (TPR) repeat protein